MNHYWSLNFNSQSSLLSGAVVAGDAGNASIYYNPSTISEIQNGGNLSFAASLFTWDVNKLKNALGEGIDLSNTSFYVQPQFLSYSFRPENSKFAFVASAITRLKERLDISYFNSEELDVIESTPGDELYISSYKYYLDYSDTWFGVASSYSVSPKFNIGISLYLSALYMSYTTSVNTIAYSTTDTLQILGEPYPSPVTEGLDDDYVKFTNYRLVSKIGFSYKSERWRLGLNITTPSISLFSTGTDRYRKQRVTNVTNPENNILIPGFVIVSGETKDDDIKMKSKLPFSISFGFIYEVDKKDNRLYFTMEYFAGVSPYKMVDAPIKDNITSSSVYNELDNKDWLSMADVATPVFNFSLGYRWELKEDVMFLNGLRTDFNTQSNADYDIYSSYDKIKSSNINIYHYTAGFQFYFLKKHLLVAGGQLSFGYDKGKKQIANFSNPVEYNPEEKTVLQGTQKNTMDSYYYGFNIYLSATLNLRRDSK